MKKNNQENEDSFYGNGRKTAGKSFKHDVYTDYIDIYFQTFLRPEIVQKVFFLFSEYQSHGPKIKARIQIPPSPRNIQIYIYINQNSSMSGRQISQYTELYAPGDQKPSSTILAAIPDRNFYEDLVTIIVQLCKENGLKQTQLEKIEECLSQRIPENQPMLIDDQKSNVHMQRQKYPNQLKKFKKSKRWLPIPDQINLLNLIQNDLAYTRQRQSIYFALEKYIKQRQEQLCPQLYLPQPTRKERFRQGSKFRTSFNSLKANSNGMKWPPKQKERIDYKQLYNSTLSSNLSITNQSHQLMRKFTKLKTMYGHSYQQALEEFCPVYNAIFDCTEKLIISAGQDGLIKIWSKETGQLLGNLRGHQTYINKVCTSKCNKYLISTAADGIRFYCLATLTTFAYFPSQTIVDVATFYQNQQTVSIFSEDKLLHFVSEKTLQKKRNYNLLKQQELISYSLEQLNNKDRNLVCQLIINKERILIIGFECGKIVIANFDELFNPTITENHEQKLITGKYIEKKRLPYLKQIQAHNAEIMEIRWNQFTSQFVTGCKEGVCRLWEVRKDNAPHTPNILIKIDQFKIPKNALKRRKKTIACNYVIWNCTYTHIIASFYEILENDDGRQQGEGQIIVFSVQQKRIVMELSKQVDFSLNSMTSIDSHPYFSNIVIASETSGKIYIIDIYLKIIVNMFEERAIHLRHPQFSLIITECRFSQNGLYFILGTQYGSISLYGYDLAQFYKLCPDEQFLQTDYLPFRLDDVNKQPLIVGGNLDGKQVNQIPRGNVINNIKEQYQYMPKNCYELYKKKIDEQLERERLKFLQYGQEDLMLDRATKQIEMQIQHRAQNKLPQQLLKVQSKRLKQYQALQQPMKSHYEQQLCTHRSVVYTQNLKYKEEVAQTIKGKIEYLKQLDPKYNVVLTENSQPNSKSAEIVQKRGNQQPKRGGRLKRHSERTREVPTFNQYIDEYDEEQNNDKQQQEFNLEQEDDENIEESSQYSENDSYIEQNNRKSTRKRSMRVRRYQYNQDQSEQAIGSHPYRNRRKLPEQQVKELQEDYDKLKKKRKLNQPIQQQHVHTRRTTIQQNHTHQEAYCNRCKFQISILKCTKCSSEQSQVCKNCQNCRGKGYPYMCFNCKFLQNNSIDIDNFRTNNQYYKVSSRDYRRHYVPQIGEDVYFFFQGYEEFLYFNIQSLSMKLITNSGFVPANEFELTPHYHMQQLLENPICKIVDLCYCYPLKKLTASVGFDISDRKRNRVNGQNYQEKQIITILKLKLVNSQPQNKIFYIFSMPNAEFIYPAQSFNRLVAYETKLNQDLILSDVFGEEVQIVQLKPYDQGFPLSRWKFTKIRKTEGKRLRNSKNNERRVNLWNLKLQGQEQEEIYEDCLKKQEKQGIMAQINRIKQQSSQQWQIFSENPETQVLDYKQIVQVPSYLTLITDRIQNKYYSTKQSLIRDIELIRLNAQKYNGQSAPIAISAAQLSERLKKALEGYKFQAPNGHTQIKQSQEQIMPNNRNKRKRQINILQSTSSQQKSRQRNRRGRNNVDEFEVKEIHQKVADEPSEEYDVQQFAADQDENYNYRSKGRKWNLRQPRNNRFTKNYPIENETEGRMTRSRNKH